MTDPAGSMRGMRAVVLGVNGVTGRAIAAELAGAGWDVLGTGSSPDRFPAELGRLGVEFTAADRYDADELAAVLGPGADLVVDCLCYTVVHAWQLLAHRAGVGGYIVLSSKAVYVDAAGRHVNSDEPPDFGGPIREDQATLAPDSSLSFDTREGYGPNKVAAEHALLDSGASVSVLRASLVHGAGARNDREDWVVRRLARGRRRIPLAHRGESGNHPTAAVNLARLVRVCAERPGSQVLNAADPGTPDAAAVVRAIATGCGVEVEIVGLAHHAPPHVGDHPWNAWPPIYLDTSAADDLGYRPVGDYAAIVAGPAADAFARHRADDPLAGVVARAGDDDAGDDAALAWAYGEQQHT